MPTPTKYTKSVTSDFKNGKVDTSALWVDISDDLSIVVALDPGNGIQKRGVNCDIWFKDALPEEQQSALTTRCWDHDGEPLPSEPQTVKIQGQQREDNALPIAEVGAHGADIDEFTPNFCDRTTWWPESTGVEDETLTDSGDGLTFESAHPYWIDLVSGKITEEIALRSTYTPVVSINGSPATRRSSFSDTGGDYSVDWDAGTVTFFSSQSGNTITASYYYESGSAWTITPPEGKMYSIESGKFLVTTNDFNMTTSFHYEVLVGEYVAGQSVYDSLAQLVDTAAGNLGVLEGPIGTGVRALPAGAYQSMGVTYVTTRDLYNSMGMSLRIRLGNDEPFDGTRCTMRLLGRVYDEE